MSEQPPDAGSDWLEMTDAQFDEIREKSALILRTLPGAFDKSEATARAILAQAESRELETLSRKRMSEQLLSLAEASLQQADYMRGLIAMMDSTWRCLTEIRSAWRADRLRNQPPEEPPASGGDDGE
jgi:hypothetical protein